MGHQVSSACKSIVLLLSRTGRSWTSAELAPLVGKPREWVTLELARLDAEGVVAPTPTGYCIGPRAVVGLRGYVGRLEPAGSWG